MQRQVLAACMGRQEQAEDHSRGIQRLPVEERGEGTTPVVDAVFLPLQANGNEIANQERGFYSGKR